MREQDVNLNAKARLLLVDDDPVNMKVLGAVFDADYEVFCAASSEEALNFCRQSPPDLMLLDILMPDISGIDVCKKMKAESALADIPIIFITTQATPEEESSALSAGAVDFISKPVNPAVVKARVRTHLTLKLQSDFLRSLAFIDGLTGVANRRRLDEFVDAEWRRGRRNQTPMSLVLIDIDNFKQYNDAYGHQAGDACLKSIATALKNTLRRPQDLTARYGGEEFACVLPETPLHAARNLAEALRRAVLQLGIAYDGALEGVLTISLGVSCLIPDPESSPRDLVAMADTKLYHAKATGKNRVEV